MRLQPDDLQTLLYSILNKIQLDIIRGNAEDELENILSKYNLSEMIEDVVPSSDFYRNNIRWTKILVIAFDFPNVDRWKLAAKKKYGIPEDRIEFQAIKSNFDYERLRNTDAYSDIIVGPVPHKGVGIGDNSSFLAAVANHPEEYPKIHRMQDGTGTLIISQSAFERCLANTNFVKECL